jgi:RNA polymerase sigma-70 factor, ECF subfamily
MIDRSETVVTFEAERPHLFAVAYRMLGSAAEAEDVLQEAFVRWDEKKADTRETIESPRAFLTTIVVRLCLDQLKSARARREKYVGPWLPEPIAAKAPYGDDVAARPDARAELAESLSIAFLVLLERLSPLERAAFLLREVFDRPFDEVATTLGTSEAACRQLVSRARAHVDEGRPRFSASDEKKQALLQAFLGACSSGDPAVLSRLLADDVVLRSDGGGKVHAALKPVYGPDRVSRFVFGVMKKGMAGTTGLVDLTTINGEPAIVIRDESGHAKSVLILAIANDRIADVFIVVNPEKLARA